MAYSLFSLKKDASDKKFIKESIEMILENLKPNGEQYEKYEIKRFGRLLEVEAYYHEVDEYYKCIGLEVEIESQLSFGEGENKRFMGPDVSTGFYATWKGKSHDYAPITFEESYQDFGKEHRFENGLGDYAMVTKELASVETVQMFAESIKF